MTLAIIEKTTDIPTAMAVPKPPPSQQYQLWNAKIASVLTALTYRCEDNETRDWHVVREDLHAPGKEQLNKQRNYGLTNAVSGHTPGVQIFITYRHSRI